MRMKEDLQPELGVTIGRDTIGKLARLSKPLKDMILVCLAVSQNCVR